MRTESASRKTSTVRVPTASIPSSPVLALAAAFALVLWSPPLGAQIAVDSSSNATGTTASLSWSHTVSGSNRILIVGTSHRDATQTVTGVTYGGLSLTPIGSPIVEPSN